jgi:hypothetical protein
VCWVLDGVFGARACACNERVRLRVCSCAWLCPFARARVRACLHASVSACACVRAIPSDCNSARVRAPRRCARPPIARRRLAVFIARPVPRVAAARAVAFGATGRWSRAFCRRCHLDVPHGQRDVGWPSWAHVRGRRRRRHLRPRRHQRQRQHRLQRRVVEHRRRCAGRTPSGGDRGVL